MSRGRACMCLRESANSQGPSEIKPSLLFLRAADESQLLKFWHSTQDSPQAFQRAQMSSAGRRFIQTEYLGGLDVTQLLEVPQDDDFAVGRIHAIECIAQSAMIFR